MVPARSARVSRVPAYSGSRQAESDFAYGAVTLSGWLSQSHSAVLSVLYAVRTPGCTHPGLPSCLFARRYWGNRSFFLFLALLRCFSSGGSPPCVMYWRMDGCSQCSRVSPFGYLWINGHVPLPTAFRSLSRPSSALSAKASTLCSYLLDLVR